MKYERFAELVDGLGTGYRDVYLMSKTFGLVKLIFCAPMRQWHLDLGPVIVCFDEIRPSVHSFALLYRCSRHTGTLDLKDYEEVDVDGKG